VSVHIPPGLSYRRFWRGPTTLTVHIAHNLLTQHADNETRRSILQSQKQYGALARLSGSSVIRRSNGGDDGWSVGVGVPFVVGNGALRLLSCSRCGSSSGNVADRYGCRAKKSLSSQCSQSPLTDQFGHSHICTTITRRHPTVYQVCGQFYGGRVGQFDRGEVV